MKKGRKTQGGRASASPYASTIIEIICKDGGSLKIHKDILKACPALWRQHEESLESSDGSIRIDDMTCTAGHIMVHYLYSGTYSAAEPQATSPDENKTEKLATALQVHRLAAKLELPLLADLASQKARDSFAKLDMLALLKVIESEFPGINFIDDWIATYLANRITSEFQALTHESVTLLLNDIGRVESLNGIVMKCMLQLWRKNINLNNDASAEASPSTISNVDICDQSANPSECFTTESVDFSDGFDAISA